MYIKLIKFKGKVKKVSFKFGMGGIKMKTKKNMTKVSTMKCAQSHTDQSVAREMITRNRLGLPMISGGGKTMRELYRETR